MNAPQPLLRPVAFLVASGDAKQVLAQFPVAPCNQAWDGIHDNFAQLRELYDICISAAEIRNVRSSVRSGLKILIWCETPQSYLVVRDLAVQAIAFVPSPLTLLDAQRTSRATLAMRAAVAKGEIIRAQDVGTNDNGSGVDASLLDVFVGQRAAYDLTQGAALDFGKILDD